MLSDTTAIATVPVRNLETARTFYEGTLGLSRIREDGEALTYKTGASTMFVYRSQYAGTNKATAVTFVRNTSDLQRRMR